MCSLFGFNAPWLGVGLCKLAVILLWSDSGVKGLTVKALRDPGLRSVIKLSTVLLPRYEL